MIVREKCSYDFKGFEVYDSGSGTLSSVVFVVVSSSISFCFSEAGSGIKERCTGGASDSIDEVYGLLCC